MKAYLAIGFLRVRGFRRDRESGPTGRSTVDPLSGRVLRLRDGEADTTRRLVRPIAALYVLLGMAPVICMSDEYFRCGSSLVSADMSVAELLNKCGDPSSKEVSTHDVYTEHGVKTGTSTTEVWRYDRGSRAAPMTVTIVDGQIQSMERGS